jgi:hypothetical protein
LRPQDREKLAEEVLSFSPKEIDLFQNEIWCGARNPARYTSAQVLSGLAAARVRTYSFRGNSKLSSLFDARMEIGDGVSLQQEVISWTHSTNSPTRFIKILCSFTELWMRQSE